MIKLCIQYPSDGSSFFDFNYYLDVHLPMAEQLLRDFGFQGYEVQRCTATISGDAPEFLCITQIEFSSLDELRQGMQAHGAELSADFARYTDSKPVATVTEVIAKK
jgi:uncharacterized protein (TIGR02118 family)